MRPPIVSSNQGILVTVHVVTNSRETKIQIEPDGGVTMHVNARPVKGEANREIVKWLSRKLAMSSSLIRIVAGLTSNLKVIAISGINEHEFLEAIGQKQAPDS